MTELSVGTRLVNGFKLVAAFAGLGLFLGFGIGSDRSMPANAVLYLDHTSRVYIAPPCVTSRGNLAVATAAAAYALKYRPEAKCRDEGGFVQEDRSLTGHLLEKIGILGPVPSRWNADGSWNW